MVVFEPAEALQQGRTLLEIRKQTFVLQQKLAICRKPTEAEALFTDAQKLLKPSHLDGVVEERAMTGVCGFPGCAQRNLLSHKNISTGRNRARLQMLGKGGARCPFVEGDQRYLVDRNALQTYDLEALGQFCTVECKRKLEKIRLSFSDEPAWATVDKDVQNLKRAVASSKIFFEEAGSTEATAEKTVRISDGRAVKLQQSAGIELPAGAEKFLEKLSGKIELPQNSGGTIKGGVVERDHVESGVVEVLVGQKSQQNSSNAALEEDNDVCMAEAVSEERASEEPWTSEIIIPEELAAFMPPPAAQPQSSARVLENHDGILVEEVLPSDENRRQEKEEERVAAVLPAEVILEGGGADEEVSCESGELEEAAASLLDGVLGLVDEEEEDLSTMVVPPCPQALLAGMNFGMRAFMLLSHWVQPKTLALLKKYRHEKAVVESTKADDAPSAFIPSANGRKADGASSRSANAAQKNRPGKAQKRVSFADKTKVVYSEDQYQQQDDEEELPLPPIDDQHQTSILLDLWRPDINPLRNDVFFFLQKLTAGLRLSGMPLPDATEFGGNLLRFLLVLFLERAGFEVGEAVGGAWAVGRGPMGSMGLLEKELAQLGEDGDAERWTKIIADVVPA